MTGSSLLLLRAGRKVFLYSIVLLFLLPVPGVPAREPRLKTAGSSSGRFHVAAPDSVIAVHVARWAEDVARRLEQALGIKMTFGSSRSFRIVVRADKGESDGSVSASRTIADGNLVQQLAVDDFSGADWEEGLEKLCGLLVEGYAAERRAGRDAVPEPVSVPEWLPAGLAQYVDPALRVRNREILQNWQKEGGVPAFAEVLKWHVLPPGRTRERSVCGVAVAWLCSMSGKATLFDRIFEYLCAGESLSPERIVAAMPACKTADDMEAAWRGWVDRECSVVAKPGALSSDWIRMLREQLAAVPGECCVPPDLKWPAPAELGTLIGVKKADWMPGFCAAKTAVIRTMEAGRPQEFVDAAESYVVFLEALEKCERDRTIEKLLAQADKAIDELDRQVGARERYMDEMERVYGGGDTGKDKPPADVYDVVERSKLQRYIDTVEERTKKTEHGAAESGN